MYWKNEISYLYGLSQPTFKALLKEHGLDNNRRMFTPKELQKIFQILGEPSGWEIVRYANGSVKWFKDLR